MGIRSKKFISILLIAVMFVGILPVNAFAATSLSKGDNIKVIPDDSVKVEDFIDNMNKEMKKLYGIDTNSINFTVATNFGTARVYKIVGMYEENGERVEKDFGYTFAYGKPYGYKNGFFPQNIDLPRQGIGSVLNNHPFNSFGRGVHFGAAVFVKAFWPQILLATQAVPTVCIA